MATVSSVTEAVYRSRFQDDMSAGAAAAARAMKDLGSSVVVTDEAVTRATKSARSLVSAKDELTQAAKRAEKSTRDLAAAEQTLTDGVAKGEVTQDQAARALTRLSSEADKARDRLTALRAAYASADDAARSGATGAQLYADRMEMAAVAAQKAASYQASINQSLSVGQGGDYSSRAADIAAYGTELDRLRAKYNPLFAAQQQYRATLTEIAQAERVGALATKEAAAAKEATKAAFAGQVVAMNQASTAMKINTQAISAGGLQLQDFVVQVGAGQSALTAFGQQAPQFLGIFGPTGAIAGAAVAILAVAAGFIGLKTNSERATEEFARQQTQYEETTARAQTYIGALRAQGDQYRDMTAAGDLYRAGLRGEGETLVQLTRYYQGMTEARRALEQQGISTSGRLIQFNQTLLNRDISSAVNSSLVGASSSAGATDITSDTAAIAAGGASASRPDYDAATAALTRFRGENDRSVEAVLRLWNQLREAANQNGDYSASINRMAGEIEKLIPALDRLDEAQRRQQNRQLAAAGQASPQQLRALADQAATEIGGRYQTQQRIQDQRRDIQGGMANATPEQRAGYRSSLQSLAQQQEGLTPATTQQLRALQEQATLSRTAEGAARDLATAEMELDRAARAAGMGHASAAEKAEASRLVQERLIQTLNNSLVVLNAQIAGEQRIAQAYGVSTSAGQQMEAQVRAEADALKTAKEGTALYNQVVATLTVRYQELTRAQAERQQAQRNVQTRDELAYMEREQQLIGETAQARERELAVFRARQEAERNKISGTPAALEAERLAGQMADVRQSSEQLRNSWNELATFGESAFSKIGDALTQGFAQGKIEAIKFGDIAKAMLSEVLQAALKLAVVNPLLNSMFGGTRGTLGGITQVAGIGGLGNLGLGGSTGTPITDASGSITGYIGQAGNLSSGQTILSGLRGFNPGNYISGASPINTGFGGVDSFLNTPLSEGAANAAFANGFSEAGTASGSAGLTIGGTALGAAGIAGGLYGAYSGVERGGVGGYTQAAGGAATAAMSAAAIAGLSVPVAGWIAAAVLAIAGALLPGEKASGKGQEFRVDLLSGNTDANGLGGSRSSAANASQAEQAARSIANLSGQISSALGGLQIPGEAAVGVTSKREGEAAKLYLEVSGRKAQFENTDEGAKDLADQAAKFLLEAFRDQAQGDYKGILDGSPTVDALQSNLDWYNNVYKSFDTGADAANQFAQQMEALNQSFGATTDKARSLSLSTDGISAAWEKAQQQLQTQKDLQLAGYDVGLTIRSLQAGGGDSTAIQQQVGLMQFDMAAKQQLEQAKATLESLGLSVEDVATRIATNETVLAQERLKVQQDYADQAAGIAKQSAAEIADAQKQSAQSVLDWLNGQALGANSSLTGAEKLSEAERQFRAAQAGGDAQALTSSADSLLGVSREVLGGATAAYAQRENFVRQSVANAGISAGQAGGNADVVAALSQMVVVLQSQLASLGSKFDAMTAEQRRQNDLLRLAA